MTEQELGQIRDFIIPHLNRIHEENRAVRIQLDRIEHRFDELTHRVGSLERRTADINSDIAGLSVRFDRMDERNRRVERRLELEGENK